MGVESILAPFMQQADLYIAILGVNVRFCRDEVRRHERGEDRSASPPGWLTITWAAAGTPAVDAAAHPSPITIAERSRPLPWRTREEPPSGAAAEQAESIRRGAQSRLIWRAVRQGACGKTITCSLSCLVIY